jgi:hypothetical protein
LGALPFLNFLFGVPIGNKKQSLLFIVFLILNIILSLFSQQNIYSVILLAVQVNFVSSGRLSIWQSEASVGKLCATQDGFAPNDCAHHLIKISTTFTLSVSITCYRKKDSIFAVGVFVRPYIGASMPYATIGTVNRICAPLTYRFCFPDFFSCSVLPLLFGSGWGSMRH